MIIMMKLTYGMQKMNAKESGMEIHFFVMYEI